MTSNPPDYNSFINPTDEGIGAGTITWWIEAVDGAGVATLSEKQTITVVRCDAPATITSTLSQPPKNTLLFGCATPPQVVFRAVVRDPDEPNPARIGVAVAWRLTHGTAVLSGSVGGVYDGDGGWSAALSSATVNSWNRQDLYGDNRLTWTVTSTDTFGGTTSKAFGVALTIGTCTVVGAVPPPVTAAIARAGH